MLNFLKVQNIIYIIFTMTHLLLVMQNNKIKVKRNKLINVNCLIHNILTFSNIISKIIKHVLKQVHTRTIAEPFYHVIKPRH